MIEKYIDFIPENIVFIIRTIYGYRFFFMVGWWIHFISNLIVIFGGWSFLTKDKDNSIIQYLFNQGEISGTEYTTTLPDYKWSDMCGSYIRIDLFLFIVSSSIGLYWMSYEISYLINKWTLATTAHHNDNYLKDSKFYVFAVVAVSTLRWIVRDFAVANAVERHDSESLLLQHRSGLYERYTSSDVTEVADLISPHHHLNERFGWLDFSAIMFMTGGLLLAVIAHNTVKKSTLGYLKGMKRSKEEGQTICSAYLKECKLRQE